MAEIIETTKNIVVPRIEVHEKLHGHTTIDLFNTKTKKYERIEHDNTFTDGIEAFISSDGVACNSCFDTSTNNPFSLWQRILGGVLLFNTALPTNPLPKFMPAGVTMTANGSVGVSNSSSCTELGSYNSVESSANANSITMVYDWGTAQGNGDIASVALTTQDGGYIGYGNVASGARAGQRSIINQVSNNNRGINDIKAGGDGDGNNLFLIHDNKLWIPPSGGLSNTLTINAYSCPVSELDIFYDSYNSLVDSISITSADAGYSLGFARCHIGKFDGVNTKILCVVLSSNTQYWDASLSLYFVIIDVATKTYNVYPLTRPVSGGVSDSNIGGALIFDDTYAYWRWNNTTYKIKYSTDEWETVNYNFSTFGAGKNVYFTDQLLNYSAGSIFDPVLHRVAVINCTNNGHTNSSYNHEDFGYDAHTQQLSRCALGTYYYTYTRYLLKHPMRLMTVNNLDSPVTKTADKTMKVTYTVTRT